MTEVSPETPMRRASDIPTPTRRVIDRGLALAVLAGLVMFLYRIMELFHNHTCWCDFLEPVGVGELISCLVAGLSTMSAALGLNVGSLVRGFKFSKPE